MTFKRCALIHLFAVVSTVTACQSISQLDDLKFDAGAGSRSDAATGVRDDGVKPQPPDAGPPLTQDAAPEPDSSKPCAIEDGNQCDPIAQCGCEPDKHCQVSGDNERAKCVTIGKNKPWSACESSTDCSEGQTCDRGSCRPYCKKDSDCANGACVPAVDADGKLSERYQVCWLRCDPSSEASSCAEGTSCRQVQNPRGEKASFCATAADPCPTTEDGTCDEPSGTGACAKGTDEKDCCERPDGFACEPVRQCGCQSGATCFIDPDTDKGVCTPKLPGRFLEGEHCNSPEECTPGLLCSVGTFNTCDRWCYSNADCSPGDACLNPQNTMGICMKACVRADANPACAEGLKCADLKTLGGEFCWQPIVDCSPARRNGQCEEATDFCAKGTDPEDCCEKLTPASECSPFSQCGCEDRDGTHCLPKNDLTFVCVPEGSKKVNESCANALECGRGMMCVSGTCHVFCSPDHACADGAFCMPVTDARMSTGELLDFGACFDRCDFDENNCGGDTLCIRLTPEVSHCSTPAAVCPSALIGNNACDDTSSGGSRQCALGTDPDCDTP